MVTWRAFVWHGLWRHPLWARWRNPSGAIVLQEESVCWCVLHIVTFSKLDLNSSCMLYANIHWPYYAMFMIAPPHLFSDCQQLIKWCLSIRPSDRPTLEQIFEHPWMRPAEVSKTEENDIRLRTIDTDTSSTNSSKESLWEKKARAAMSWTFGVCSQSLTRLPFPFVGNPNLLQLALPYPFSLL